MYGNTLEKENDNKKNLKNTTENGPLSPISGDQLHSKDDKEQIRASLQQRQQNHVDAERSLKNFASQESLTPLLGDASISHIWGVGRHY